MDPWTMAIYAALTFLASNKKNQAYKTGVNNQRRIQADNEAKRLALEKQNTAKQKTLLDVVDKDNVAKDSVVDSQRISALMNKMNSESQPSKIASTNAPQIVKNAMDQANKAVSSNVNKRGISKAQLQALSGQFDKYNPDFQDAETLAKNIAGKLKGNAAVRDIKVREAGNTYSQPADLIGQIAKIVGMYGMSQGKGDPSVITDDADLTAPQGGNGNKYNTYV
jgi:hypothetical protein